MRDTVYSLFFFFQAEDGIRDLTVTGVQTCALPIYFRQIDRHAAELDASRKALAQAAQDHHDGREQSDRLVSRHQRDRKSTRLNSSHSQISYAVFCLKKKKKLYTRISRSTQQ